MGGTPGREKIEYKVLHALCNNTRESDEVLNLRYLDDVSLKCMPRVFQIIQTIIDVCEPLFGRAVPYLYHGVNNEALSKVFHVVEAWEMPLLFENGGSSSRKSTGRGRCKRNRNAARS